MRTYLSLCILQTSEGDDAAAMISHHCSHFSQHFHDLTNQKHMFRRHKQIDAAGAKDKTPSERGGDINIIHTSHSLSLCMIHLFSPELADDDQSAMSLSLPLFL